MPRFLSAKYTPLIVIITIIVLNLISLIYVSAKNKEVDKTPEVVVETFVESETYIPKGLETVELIIVEEPKLTDEEIDLIALVTMAEAEGECEEGKRLVIDTILNRVDSEHFPDTVNEVIYYPNAFESMWNGRVNRCYVMEDIRQLVLEELDSRTNYEVVFFTAGRYSIYGVPMFQVENHYFSKYE